MTDSKRDGAQERALILSKAIKRRDDVHVRRLVSNFDGDLDYLADGLEALGISDDAWEYVRNLKIEAKMVFAHPELLLLHPEASLYYRGMATLSLKLVKNIAANVDAWENLGYLGRKANLETCKQVACLYNEMLSAIIEGTEKWTLEDGHRNILSVIAITQDGKIRNVIGQKAENAIQKKLLDWIATVKIPMEEDSPFFVLGEAKNLRMRFGSEPDILFERYDEQENDWTTEVTIEIKGGTDRAGALERLGAIKKSFDKTPPRSENIAILGVVTPAMRKELNQMAITDFDLYELLSTEEGWNKFVEELFFHKLRLLPL